MKHQHFWKSFFLRPKRCLHTPPQWPGLMDEGSFIECLLKMNKHRGKASDLFCQLAQDLSTASPSFISPKPPPLKAPFLQETALSPYCECFQAKLAEGQGFHCRRSFMVLWSLASDRDMGASKQEARKSAGAPFYARVPHCLVKGPFCPLSSSGEERQKAALAGQ